MIDSPLLLSLRTAFVATTVALVLGVTLARWRMTVGWKTGLLVDGLVILPLLLPPPLVGFSLLLAFGPSSPLFALVNPLFAWPATVIAAFAVSFPLLYLSARLSFEKIDTALLDQARLFGFSELRILWQVMIPTCSPAIAAGSLLTFVRAFAEFGATLMVAGNVPGRTQTLPLAIHSSLMAGEFSHALLFSLGSIVVALVCLAGLGILRRHSRT